MTLSLEEFENHKLALMYRDVEADGEVSRFYRLVEREAYNA